ncbi:TPA: hypothetical protein ACQ431_002973 [Citrobacter murliniae]
MTNNDDLALRLKEAADATPVTEWLFFERKSLSHAGGGFVSINGVEAVWCLNKAVGGMAHSMDVLRYIAAANPAAILSLLAERTADKAENASLRQRVAGLEKKETFLKEQLGQLANFNPDWDMLEAARDSLREHVARIAELEARTLTVKLPESIPCPTAPEIVWLQTNGDDSEESAWPTSDDDVSWCREKIFNNDTLYVRADIAAGINLEVGE